MALGDNKSMSVLGDEEKKAEVRVDQRTSCREETFDAEWVAKRGLVRKVVAWVTGVGVD
jgi:hypothetical protein